MSQPNFQIPSFNQFQQGAPPPAPNPSTFNPSSGGGVPTAAQVPQPGGGGSPQFPHSPQQPSFPQQQGFPTPNFQPPSNQPPANQPPTQPAWAPTSPPNATPASQPEVSPYIQELERLGQVPPGQFKTERELIERLYSVSGELAGQVDEYERRFQQAKPQQAPAQTPPPTTQPTANVATAADVAQMAAVFQQNGMLSVQNGQWVAVNPMATGVAEQMNRSVMEAQARQAELANPSAFIQKYGADVISQQLSPLKQQLEEMTRQNQLLQQQFQNSVPRPDKDWIGQNRDKLYTKDASGREVETPIGAIYRTAWNAATEQGHTSYTDIHQYALGVVAPLIGPQPQAQPPRQSWMAGVQNPQSNMYAADPSFTAPGTIFNNGVSPQHQGRPLGNDGFPTFAALQAQGIQ